MIARLEAIWLSSRNDFCNSAIAKSINAFSASRSSRRASLWVNVSFAINNSFGLQHELHFTFCTSRPTRLPKNEFWKVHFPASRWWRDQILVRKAVSPRFRFATGQWNAPNEWILPRLCTRTNRVRVHCTATFNLVQCIRFCTPMLAKTGSTTPALRAAQASDLGLADG